MKPLSNQTTLMGYVGKDPTIQKTKNGHTIARFSLSTNKVLKYFNGEREVMTTWYDIKATGHLAEFIENYGKRGSRLLLSGRLIDFHYKSKTGEPLLKKVVQANSVRGF